MYTATVPNPNESPTIISVSTITIPLTTNHSTITNHTVFANTTKCLSLKSELHSLLPVYPYANVLKPVTKIPKPSFSLMSTVPL